MILRSHNGLNKSPYSRIIFGLSVADIIQESAGMIISPFAVPSDSTRIYAPWAKGTIGACEAAGFFLQVGASAVPLLLHSLLELLLFETGKGQSHTSSICQQI